MDEDQSPSLENENPAQVNALRNTCICGLALVGVFLVIFCLSSPFEYGAKQPRPILGVTSLLLLAAVIAFVGLTNALKASTRQRKTVLMLIVSFALSTRLIALFTAPILEIDYYRYLWDGKVTAAGISPYSFSPEQVLSAKASGDSQLGQLQTLSLESESNHTILSRVHFANHTTIYPSVSQAVFGFVMSWFPGNASVESHIILMKLALVVFDLGTLLLIAFLLNRLRRNVGWLIVYAWNPLVIKEIANSGHLDSIATFFMLASISMLIQWLDSSPKRPGVWWLGGSAIALGLAVGAKLFPVVVFPALAVFISKHHWKSVVPFSILFAIVCGVALAPMLIPIMVSEAGTKDRLGSAAGTEIEQENSVPIAAKHGAVGFFSQWRMNDIAFSFAYLNFKDSKRETRKTPWYVLTSNEFRKRFETWYRANVSSKSSPAFAAARLMTLGVFFGFYCWQLIAILRSRFDSESMRESESLYLLQRLAIVLVVFLFLQPTVNPWYFVWVLPLLCFSPNRGWLIVSGLLLVYYSRFWFDVSDKQLVIAGREYDGVGIYDHVVVWIVAILALGTLVLFRFSQSGRASVELVNQSVVATSEIG